MGFLIACFVVGLIFFMLITDEGRGCLGAIFTGIFGIIVIIAVGGAIIIGLVLLLASA
jgi:hypothetical protein